MQRTLLTLALITATGTALAQTGAPPITQDTNIANANPRLSGQAGIAQKRIEADGYKNVEGLAQGPDGLWHGRAMRGGAEVQVFVDRQGNVLQQ